MHHCTEHAHCDPGETLKSFILCALQFDSCRIIARKDGKLKDKEGLIVQTISKPIASLLSSWGI